MLIISHRGIDFSLTEKYRESTKESFIWQLSQGFGIEFDIRSTKDKQLLISHDNIFYTRNNEIKKINENNLSEIMSCQKGFQTPLSLPELFELIHKYSNLNTGPFALHLKYYNQDKETLSQIINYIKQNNIDNLFVFDVTIESAKFLKNLCPNLKLMPSVVRQYDKDRFNHLVGGTLYTLEDVIPFLYLFEGVWLDEWDCKNSKKDSRLYTSDFFTKLRKLNLKIAVVSPELHADTHDFNIAKDYSKDSFTNNLEQEFALIKGLSPDAICTDWPSKYAIIDKSKYDKSN